MLFSRKPKHKPVELPQFAFFRGAESFQTWLESLPSVDGQLLARQLLAAAKEINQTDCDYEQLQEIARLLESRYLGVRDIIINNEQSKESRKNLAVLKQEFFSRFGRLFIKVGMVAAQSDEKATAERYLPLASEALATSLTSSYQLYRPPLAGGWLALHRGYLYLITRGGNSQLTAAYAQHYRCVIALACLQPAQLNCDSVDLLIKLIKERAPQVRLSPGNSGDASHRIVAGRDHGPQLLGPEENNVETLADSIYVDLNDFKEIIDDPKCSTIIKSHLQRVFEFKIHDKSNRIQTKEDFRMCLSIPAIHHQVSNGTDFVAYLKKCFAAEDEETTFEKTGSLRSDVWGSVLEGNWASLQREDGLIELEMSGNNSAQSNNNTDALQSVVALDKSQTGLLLSADPGSPNLESGSMIAVQTDQQKGWLVAAVRWHRKDGSEFKFGVQRIASNPTPAAVKVIHSQQSSSFCPALLLDSNTPTEDPANTDAPTLHIEAERKENCVIIAIQNIKLRNKTPIMFVDQSGSRRAIITETLEENTDFIICRARFIEK